MSEQGVMLSGERPLIVLPAPQEAPLTVAARMNPFTLEVTRLTVAAGATIEQILAEVGIDQRWHSHIRVWVGDRVIAPEHWRRARPKAGAMIAITIVPMGSGDPQGKSIGITVATIALIIVAVATQQYWAVPIAGYLGVSVGTVVGVATVAIGAVGAALQYALVKPQQPKLDAMSQPDALGASQTYSLQGSRNLMAIGRPVPKVLGWHRMTPPAVAA